MVHPFRRINFSSHDLAHRDQHGRRIDQGNPLFLSRGKLVPGWDEVANGHPGGPSRRIAWNLYRHLAQRWKKHWRDRCGDSNGRLLFSDADFSFFSHSNHVGPFLHPRQRGDLHEDGLRDGSGFDLIRPDH
jgi:hypothetical protein